MLNMMFVLKGVTCDAPPAGRVIERRSGPNAIFRLVLRRRGGLGWRHRHRRSVLDERDWQHSLDLNGPYRLQSGPRRFTLVALAVASAAQPLHVEGPRIVRMVHHGERIAARARLLPKPAPALIDIGVNP